MAHKEFTGCQGDLVGHDSGCEWSISLLGSNWVDRMERIKILDFANRQSSHCRCSVEPGRGSVEVGVVALEMVLHEAWCWKDNGR